MDQVMSGRCELLARRESRREAIDHSLGLITERTGAELDTT
jgi:hypothetical protein